jgi:hypothetical protein
MSFLFGIIAVNMLVAIILNGFDTAKQREEQIDLYELNEMIRNVEALLWFWNKDKEQTVHLVYAEYVPWKVGWKK